MPAAEVVEQVPFPGEPRPAQLALEGRHTLRELRGQVLHEVVAVVHLQIVLLGLQALAAHLTLTPSSVPGPCSPSIRGEQGRWNRMGVVITAQDKSLDVTFSINEGGLLLIFTFTVWYNKMFNIAIRNSGQNVAPTLEITLSGEVTGFHSNCPQPVLSLLS